MIWTWQQEHISDAFRLIVTMMLIWTARRKIFASCHPRIELLEINSFVERKVYHHHWYIVLFSQYREMIIIWTRQQEHNILDAFRLIVTMMLIWTSNANTEFGPQLGDSFPRTHTQSSHRVGPSDARWLRCTTHVCMNSSTYVCINWWTYVCMNSSNTCVWVWRAKTIITLVHLNIRV